MLFTRALCLTAVLTSCCCTWSAGVATAGARAGDGPYGKQLNNVDLYILTQHRTASLSDTINAAAVAADVAATTAISHGCSKPLESIDLHIHIDAACNDPFILNQASPIVSAAQQHAAAWKWGASTVACLTDAHAGESDGILAQWARVPAAMSNNHAVLVVEDDVLLAPQALCALRQLWSAAPGVGAAGLPSAGGNNAMPTAGVSLHHLGYSAREGLHFDASFCHCVLRASRAAGAAAAHALRSPVVSTWGFSPHPRTWGAFLQWLKDAHVLQVVAPAAGPHQLAGVRGLRRMQVDGGAFRAVLTAAADVIHARQAMCSMQGDEGAHSNCVKSFTAPYVSLLWGMQDAEGGRAHQIWSAAFHAFSVLQSPLAAQVHNGMRTLAARTWGYETVYPCFPRAEGGRPRVAALHTRAQGVHHEGGGAGAGVLRPPVAMLDDAGLASAAMLQGPVLDWDGSIAPVSVSATQKHWPADGWPAVMHDIPTHAQTLAELSTMDARALAPAAAGGGGVPADKALNRGSPGALSTPSGAAMNKLVHASDPVTTAIQSMAWRGVANGFGTGVTRGHDYLEALRGRSIVFFGDSTDRRTLAALYDLISMGRYHLSLEFDSGCFSNPLNASSWCRTNSSATHLATKDPHGWVHMRFKELDLDIGYCLLRLTTPVGGRERPISEHVAGCANVTAGILLKPGVVAVANGWMHFLKHVRAARFGGDMSARVGEFVREVHAVLPPGAPIVLRTPFPHFIQGPYPKGHSHSMSSMKAWMDTRNSLTLLAPGRRLIEWDVFTPFFQATSSSVFKHSKTTDGMHPGAAPAFTAAVLLIELLQQELPVELYGAGQAYPAGALSQWEARLVAPAAGNASISGALAGVDFAYDQCPDCDCRFECRFWGGVKQDVDCGNGSGNGSGPLWQGNPWQRASWTFSLPHGALAVGVLLLCCCGVLVVGGLGALPASTGLGATTAATAQMLLVSAIASAANSMPPAVALLNDAGAVLFTPLAVAVLAPLATMWPASKPRPKPPVDAAAGDAVKPAAHGTAQSTGDAAEQDSLLSTAADAVTIVSLANELEASSQHSDSGPGGGGPIGRSIEPLHEFACAGKPSGVPGSSPPPTPAPPPRFGLHRELTEEWKGWMQLWFLLYHVLRAEAAYPYIRWTVSAYVFLTGYGNTLYYFNNGKVSLQRICSMLLRMCLFSAVLSAVTGTPWHQYYIPFLHAVHYLSTTAACLLAMWLQRRCAMRFGGAWGLALLLALLPGMCLQSSDVGALVQGVLRSAFGDAGGAYLLMRLQLDRYSSAVGIAAAFLQMAANKAPQTAGEEGSVPWGVWLAEGLLSRWRALRLCASLALALVGVGVAWTHPTRAQYKLVNAYVGTLWIPAYLECRLLLLPWVLRKWHSADAGAGGVLPVSSVLAWFGRHSLECYLLQFHMLMTSSAGAILVLVPQSVLLSVLVQGAVYLCCSHVAFVATDSLRRLLGKYFWEVLGVCCVSLTVPWVL